jgi:hypothetical protein
MINFSDDDYTKLRLLDTMFNVLTAEELAKMVEGDLIVGKLKGQTPQNHGPLSKLHQQVSISETEVVILRGQVSMLEQRLQTLVKCLSKGMGDYQAHQDFIGLKSQLNIYP